MLRLRLATLAATIPGLLYAGAELSRPSTGRDDLGPQLERIGYEAVEDEDGDWVVLVEFDDGRTQLVYVMGDPNEIHDAEVREVLAPAHNLTASDDEEALSARLLVDNQTMTLANWALYDDVIFAVARIPADAEDDFLDAAIQEVSGSADVLEEELTGDADEF